MGAPTAMVTAFLLLAISPMAIGQSPSLPSQGAQLVATGALAMYVDPLPNMPKLYGYTMMNGSPTSSPLTIGMYQKTWKFHRDLPPTPVFVFGTSAAAATFPGPTIMARQGTPLPITWQNHLPQSHILPWDATVPIALPKGGGVPTVVHLHGSVHPPHSDGSALAWFTADFRETGPKWSQSTYTYPNVQPPGNLWYHDHALGLTRLNILAGLLGAYVIHKPVIDDPLDLPKGVEFDRHLIIVDRSFNTDGTLYVNSTGVNPLVHPTWRPEYFGEAIIVNGKAWPFLDVRRRRYRFRILNASNARYLRLSLSNGLPFHVVGSDSSYLSASVTAASILLAPAEIADVVVDFSNSTTTTAELTNNAPYPYPSGASPQASSTGKVMRFNILPGKPERPDDSRVPDKEVNYTTAPPAGEITTTRYIALYEYASAATGESTHLYINGRRFEDPVTETPKAGTTELWEVINLTADNHPIHVHLGMLQAVRVRELVGADALRQCMDAQNDAVKCDVAGHAVGKTYGPPEHERTWKNVIKVDPGTVTSVVIAFKLVDTNESYPFDVTGEPGYVYHCHILDHEDNEMIRPLKFLA